MIARTQSLGPSRGISRASSSQTLVEQPPYVLSQQMTPHAPSFVPPQMLGYQPYNSQHLIAPLSQLYHQNPLPVMPGTSNVSPTPGPYLPQAE
jgi:hypothetical protein